MTPEIMYNLMPGSELSYCNLKGAFLNGLGFNAAKLIPQALVSMRTDVIKYVLSMSKKDNEICSSFLPLPSADPEG